MNRALTQAETLDITGTEPPLTDIDIEHAVRTAYSDWRAGFALAGDPRGRTANWGCGDEYLFCVTDHRGLWVSIAGDPRRAGHISWAVAEEILRRDRDGRQDALFDVAMSA